MSRVLLSSSTAVPARAGVFLISRVILWTWGRRPRPRGGLPRCGYAARHGRRAVPARAGVFLSSVPLSAGMTGRPRPRGGLPQQGTITYPRPQPSPPARGSSAVVLPSWLRWCAVPARAGVFPCAARSTRAAPCRPRPRGGLPAGTFVGDCVYGPSPPARGSSMVVVHDEGLHRAVPARAGVFPTHQRPDAPSPHRPRPRGGL